MRDAGRVRDDVVQNGGKLLKFIDVRGNELL
jgi:hypothetical protein